MLVGILALQGDFEAHARVLTRLNIAWQFVRSPEALAQVHALILPGGESTTALHLLEESQLFKPIQVAGHNGMPMFGTCAGAILLAKTVIQPKQNSLDLVDITVERNAYGRQLASRVVQGIYKVDDSPMEMCFIRAPRFTHVPPEVKILAECDGQPVCIQQGQYLLAAFHPELTQDGRLHQYFCKLLEP